jgi:uncharacterized protein YjbJ (UPF0337 family)
MDKDRVKGKVDDVAGRVKRQVGEWTDDTELQTEGAAQQVKGKVENVVGKAKDAVREVAEKAKIKRDEHRTGSEYEQSREIDREQRKKDVA